MVRMSIKSDLRVNVQRYAATVEYLGTHYQGWQKQPNAISVQEVLEKSLSAVANQPIATICAGRTDAGVHGLGQVVHFDAPVGLREPNNWLLGGNGYLPNDVKILNVNLVPADFHARFSATGRHYHYLLKISKGDGGVFYNHCGHCNYHLDINLMKEAASCWLGQHDFSAFRSSRCQAKNPVRNLTKLRITQQNDMLLFEVSANAFLHRMVRMMVAALVEIGRGRRSIAWAQDLLKPNGISVETVVAAKGLYLVEVDYPSLFGIDKTPSKLYYYC